jgi:hypothetical protein
MTSPSCRRALLRRSCAAVVLLLAGVAPAAADDDLELQIFRPMVNLTFTGMPNAVGSTHIHNGGKLLAHQICVADDAAVSGSNQGNVWGADEG